MEDLAAKRVAIATDIIKQLDAHKLHVDHGKYFGNWGDVRETFLEELDARPYINTIQDMCTVCQLGALLLSKIRLYNEHKIETIVKIKATDDDVMYDSLANIFPYKMLQMMEMCFEHYYLNRRHGGLSEEEQRNCKEFTRGLSPEDRIRKVMTNIIENGGDLVLPGVPTDKGE